MRARTLVLAAIGLLLATAPLAEAITYSGSLSGDDFVAKPGSDWDTPDAFLSWEITDLGDEQWHYSYTFSVPRRDLSHLIIEASNGDDPFTSSNILDSSWPSGRTEVKLHLEGQQSNIGILGDLYGIKFDDTSGTSPTFWFTSDRAPVWGDFYAKGGQIWAYNAGFLAADPIAAPSNGSLFGHLLVPDTFGFIPPPPAVPEPATIAAVGLGLAGLGRYGRGRLARR